MTILAVLKFAGIVLACVIGLIIIEMIIAVFAPWIKAPKQKLQKYDKEVEYIENRRI